MKIRDKKFQLNLVVRLVKNETLLSLIRQQILVVERYEKMNENFCHTILDQKSETKLNVTLRQRAIERVSKFI